MYICQKCRKSRAQLAKEGKLNLVQGYEQCADCHSDLEHASVVEIDDIRQDALQKAIANNDYNVIPVNERSRNLAKVLGIEAEDRKVPNAFKYYPKWYQDKLTKDHKETTREFRGFAKIMKDYNEVI